MVTSPLVSVLLPTHNRPDVLGLAIQSVLDQTYTNFELLIVGDGCVGDTTKVVQSFNDKRIRFFDFPKAPGFGYGNRNKAIREARGTYIGFAADDDLLFPDHLENLLETASPANMIVYSQALWVSSDGIAAPFLTNLEVRDELEYFLNVRNSIPASCFLYRADALPRLDVWPEEVSVAADWRLWQTIIKENAVRPVYCRTPTVLHFSAKRKNSRHSAVSQLLTYLEIADKAPWWPNLLCPDLEGSSEQVAYAKQMRQDPANWAAKIRKGAKDVVAKIAWDDIQLLRPQLTEARQRNDVLTKQNDALSQQVNLCNSELISLKQHSTTLEDRNIKMTEHNLALENLNSDLANKNVRLEKNNAENIDALKSARDTIKSLECVIGSATQNSSELEIELGVLNRDIGILREELRNLHGSTSWRVTSPIRLLKSAFSRNKQT